jgi:predicted dienelactone hydrolase
MRVMLKIVIGVVLSLALLALGIYTSFFFDPARSEHRVGFQKVMVRDSQDKPLDIGIWYPTASQLRLRIIGFSPQMLATDGTVAQSKLPLVLISHGAGGMFGAHADTALALASAGFVVAAVTHTDDDAMDYRYVGMPRSLIDRPREIHLMLEYMLNDWPAHRQIDATRVGIFGFSNGGLTALISIGGVPDSAQIASHWKDPPAPAQVVPETVWVHDPAIKAAVLVAPAFSRVFEPSGLSRVTAAVQLWSGTLDPIVPYETGAAVVRRLLPEPPEYHAVTGAGHLTFLAPCPSIMRLLPFCRDVGGFDRAAFHRNFNRSVIAFFQQHM